MTISENQLLDLAASTTSETSPKVWEEVQIKVPIAVCLILLGMPPRGTILLIAHLHGAEASLLPVVQMALDAN